MQIAYLINQYPKVSHSFIRREIAELEAQGIAIARFSIRSCAEELVDPGDLKEREKTRIVLSVGALGLLFGLVRVALLQPTRLIEALGLAFRISRHSERGMLIHLIYLAEACVLLRWFSERSISHVHAHFGTNSTTVAMLCQALGGPPYSFTVHGPEEFDKAQAIALSEKIKRAAFVVAISSFGKSQLFRWCDYTQWSKIQVVRCGVDREFLHLPYQAIPDSPQLVCVGRLCEQKGQLLLIEAAARLAAQGWDFKLILVGDGSLRSEIEALIEQFKLQDRIAITGWASSEDVQRYILAARALVLPSFAEGLPVVIMESLALGRPVISTYVAGIPELVEPGICGWLVPAGSIEDLVDAMRAALQLPIEQLAVMGQQGAKRIQQRHDISKEVKKLIHCFESAT
jgi:glycosyltransferase involved in cell wall biosynthesis